VPRLARRRSSVALALLATVPVAALAAAPADAARAPSRGEAAAIERVALRTCRSAVGVCRYGHARVSTRDARYAWAQVIGNGFSGVLLQRPTTHSRRFRVIGSQGGGVSSCTYWRARAPLPVLRDLRVAGLLDASGAAGNCGRV
jgi:hypothetical protein